MQNLDTIFNHNQIPRCNQPIYSRYSRYSRYLASPRDPACIIPLAIVATATLHRIA